MTTTAAHREPSLPDLVSRLLDGDLDAAGQDELAGRLRGDAEAIELYRRLLVQHAMLHWTLGPAREPAMAFAPPPRIATTRQGWGVVAWGGALAAAIVIVGAAVAIYLIASTDGPTPRPIDYTPIATLIDSEGTVLIGDEIGRPGSDYAAQPITVDDGSAEFQLSSGANVKLIGATRLTMHGALSATLAHGTAVFDCPPGAHGFTVHLPDGGKVIDLGTVFEIRVAPDGRTSVAVTKGAVQWFGPDGTFVEIVAGYYAIAAPGERATIYRGPTATGDIQVATLTGSELITPHDDSIALRLFAERRNVRLDRDTTVGFTEPGTYLTNVTRRAIVTSGTDVDSYLLHVYRSRTATDAEPVVRYRGMIRFDRPIVAVITQAAQLNATNTVFTPAGVTPQTGADRGMDAETNDPNHFDRLTLRDDRRTLDVDIAVGEIDELRVLVMPADSQNDEQPSTHPSIP